MSNSIYPEIQDIIKDWRDKLADSSNSNPLLNFQKSKKARIDILTSPLILFQACVGEESRVVPLEELKTKQTESVLIKLLDKLRGEAKKTLEEKGFNSLFLVLGSLTWFDTAKPQEQKEKEKLVSPLLLIPVELKKKGKKQPEYTLCPADEEIAVNFLLVNKLRDEFNITLPEVETIQKLGYEEFINAVRNTIAEKQGWQLEEDAYITLFASVKTAMIKDLEQNQELIANHPILQKLALKEAMDTQSQVKIITDKELDTIKPELVYQICDADSSQQLVIEAAKVGISFVVQGPPGTGKSQTIANIVAELISKDKKVLLVAEKQTALDVVYEKLRYPNDRKQYPQLTLEDLCLNLHHKGTTKTQELVKELNQTKSRLSQRSQAESQQGKWDIFFQQLDDCRQSLNSYTTSLHQRHQPINKSAFELYGELLKLEREKVPLLEFNFSNIEDWSEEILLLQARDLINDLRQFEAIFRDKQKTIWSNSQIKSWNYDVDRQLNQNINKLRQGIQLSIKATTPLQELLKIEAANTLVALDKLQTVITHLIEIPPHVPKNWLQGVRLNFLEESFIELQTDIEYIQHVGLDLNNQYVPEFLTWNVSQLRKIQQNLQRYKGVFRWLNPGYWRLRRKLFNLQRVGNRVSEKEFIEDIDKAIKRQEILNQLQDVKHKYHGYFGSFFEAITPNLNAIEQALNWLKFLQNYRLDPKGIAAIIYSSKNLQKLNSLLTDLENSQKLIKEGFQFLRHHFPQHHITKPSQLERNFFINIEKFLNQAVNELSLFQQTLDFKQKVEQLEAIGAKDFLTKLKESNIQSNLWFSVLQKGVYKNWLEYIYSNHPELRNFNQSRHEQKIKDFYQFDIQQYEKAIERLRQLHAKRWQEWSEHPEARKQIQLLDNQHKLQKGHQKIRQFIKNASKLVTTLKPFWLMSPLAVSQYIDPEAVEFDVVIFDEASQIFTEDAVPSIMRAKQVIVVGDDKQLPPSSYYKSSASGDDEEQEIYESLLDESSTFLEKFTLKWHYRSKHESLIAFSNQKFYDSELLTFPNPVKNPNLGVQFHYVEGGIYTPGDGRRNNIREAQTVAELILKHVHEHPNLSLGIVTLNEQQAETICEQIKQLSLKDSKIEEFCQEESDKFFIKPLERVQGDQQEVIILSFGFGFYENSDKLVYRFGPLTNPGGRRRLNVAITRAQSKFVLVASVKAIDFKPERKNEEITLLKEYFAYAENGGEKLNDQLDNNLSDSDFIFEEDVYQALTQQGYTVKKRVGRSAYPIDLAVIDEQRKETEEFLLGIICDGTIYHKYPTARDRERLRHKVLKDLGWHIYKIWSSEWYRDRDGQIKLLVERIKHLHHQK